MPHRVVVPLLLVGTLVAGPVGDRSDSVDPAISLTATVSSARPSWVWGARMFFWGLVEPKTKAQALAYLRWLQRYGYNVVQLQPDLGRPIPVAPGSKRLYDRPVWAWDWSSRRNDILKYFIREAHARGIYVMFQANQWAIGAHRDEVGIPLLPEWKGYSALDSTGRPAFVSMAGTSGDPQKAVIAWLCPVNGRVRTSLASSVSGVVRDLGYDMFVGDWNFQGFACPTRSFRDLFLADTGLAHPGARAIASGTVESPYVRAWRDWSTGRALRRGAATVRSAIKADRPRRILFAYNSRPTRGEHESFAAFADMLGDEVSVRSSFYDWPWQLAQLRYNAAIQRRFSVPIVSLLYTDVLSENHFGWAMAHLAGQRLWRTIPSLNRIDRTYEALFRKPRPMPADVGVVFSRQTFLRYSESSAAALRDADAGPHPYEESGYLGGSEAGFGWAGWARVLAERHQTYDVLLDGDLTPSRLPAYRAVIADNAAALSDAQVANLRSYVAGGGTLIASYQTSLFDETGARRADYALQDVCGVNYTRLRAPGWSWRLESTDPDAFFSADLVGESGGARDNQYLAQVTAGAGASTLATYVGGADNAEQIPAMVVNHHGAGRCLFFTGYPGSRAFYRRPTQSRPDHESGFTFIDYSDPYYVRLLDETMGWAVPDPYLTTDAPADIQIGVLGCGSGKVCIHVLNAQGWRLPNGTVKPSDPGTDPFYRTGFPGEISDTPFDYGRGYEVPFPEYSEPIVIRLRGPYTQARAVTPGDPPREVSIARDGEHALITLNGLSRYAIIVLQ